MKKALEDYDLAAVGKLMTANHEILIEMDLSHDILIHLCNMALDMGALGAKVTGGGRGGIRTSRLLVHRGTGGVEGLLQRFERGKFALDVLQRMAALVHELNVGPARHIITVEIAVHRLTKNFDEGFRRSVRESLARGPATLEGNGPAVDHVGCIRWV